MDSNRKTTKRMGLLPHEQLVISTSPFADADRDIWDPDAGTVISAMAIIACLGSMPGWQILQTEVPISAAEQGLFADTNRHGVAYKRLICTACTMSCVLLLTLSPNLGQQFQILIVLAISACLIPYAFATISLPVMMITKRMKRGKQFSIYCILSLIELCFFIVALLGAGSQPLFWGIMLQMVTIPLYLLFIVRRQTSSGSTQRYEPFILMMETCLKQRTEVSQPAERTGGRYRVDAVYKELS